MTRPTITRSALALVVLAACGGRVPEDTRAAEADPLALSDRTLAERPSPEPGGTDTASPAPVPEPVVVAAAAGVPFEGVEITIRPGENLVGLASVADIPVELLVERNGLDPLVALVPGDSLRVPLSGEAGAAFLDARDFARADRLDRYLSTRGGLVSVESHVVRTGETAWGIARHQAGVPTWVLSAFNPDTNLDRLGIGQRVKVPVFADSVAEATPEIEAAAVEEAGVEAAAPALVEGARDIYEDVDDIIIVEPRIFAE